MNVRILALAAVLLPAVGFSQTWTVRPVPAAGESVARVVMGDASDLVVDVTNTSAATLDARLSEVSFVLPDGYQLLGGLPAETNPNWKVEYIDANERRITFQSTLGCVDNGRGLARNQTARFVLSVVGPADRSNDSATERLVAGTYARDQCDGTSYTYNVANMPAWTRAVLATNVTLLPRVLAVNGATVARVVVENRGTAAINSVAVDNPTSTTSVPLTTVSKDGSKAVAVRSAGVFVVNLRPTAAGAVAARVRARASGVNAPLADSPVADVGNLVATADMDVADAFSGDQVTLRMTVFNASTANSYTQVRPRAPVLLGTATAALVAGPSPESVAQLAPGASAQFTWRYQVSGAPGASYQFQAQVDGTLNGSAVAGDQVTARKGRIVEHRVRLSQETMSTAATSVTVAYTVQNRGSLPIYEVKLFKPAVNYFQVAASGPQAFGNWIVSSDAAGYLWESETGIPVGGEATFRITYSGFTGVLADTAFRHRLELNQGWNDPRIRVEATMTLLAVTASPDVARLTGVARDGSVTLTWDNPFNHGGTLVLRAQGATPNAAPASGVRYAVGDVLGNATVAYADEFSSASSFTDTAVTNGTTYVYRVFNADDEFRYGPGNQPTSQGLLATPRARVAGNPLWCYSVGLSSLLQPVTELGVGIFSSFNDSVVGSLTNTVNPSEDGAERFRPVKMTGLIGSRFPVVPLLGRPGQQWIVVGDQAGVPAVLNAATGEFLWKNTTLGLGNISSFPVTQLLDYANPEYRTTFSNVDLAIFATRNTSAQNQVVALNAATGALIWRYRPGDLGMVSGGMLVDYTTNRLYVATKSGTSTATLRVLNSLTGAEVARLALGDLEFGVVRNATSNQILVTANDGRVYGVNPATYALAWTVTVRPTTARAFTHFARPLGRGFVVSTADGKVERYEMDATNVPVLLWSTAIAGPAGSFTLNQNGVARIYVGSSDGKVHQLELETGIDSGQVTVGPAQAIGTPTIDHTVSRLHVGSSDGRICAFPVPF
ncbi:PQQ-binding-like beta-propeller repeat protein [Corallococcus exercitus]|uniref:PQQ-binding-like beta-propeller repeat protein n=1 Tax=Corallococcus exercitus TaxID=2316736 RepID=A0A7Y4KG09_9BACT|nr:PQQ-binding-like beta-propeller repeat protein [Corallococcus exercitus]NOK32204.1 PQQ-binding-like beta-propeller repeat protein [Corallococcus exercitus]